MLASSAHRTELVAQWNVKPWRLDLLIQPQIADEALKGAVEAHLIVIAVRDEANLSPWLWTWLEQWAEQRQVQDAALAVFPRGNGDPLSATTSPKLSRFAVRHGLNVILDAAENAGAKSAACIRDLHEREVTITRTLHHIMDQPATGSSWRHSGINE